MDYYQILGVNKDSSAEDIKKAYRKLAMQHHPDRGGDNTKFTEINQAYETLSDDTKRRQYDHQSMWAGAQRWTPDDINSAYEQQSPYFTDFADVFRGRQQQKNPDGLADVTISLAQAYSGTDLNVNVGYANEIITIPAGVRDGAKIRLKGKGPARIKNMPPGDLIVRINIDMPEDMGRDQDDLYVRLDVDAISAMTGSSVEFHHINGKILSIKIPAGVQNGAKLRIPGWGMPNPQTLKIGHLYALIRISIPKVTNQQHIDMLNIISKEVNKQQ